jgi:hypothetical protein
MLGEEALSDNFTITDGVTLTIAILGAVLGMMNTLKRVQVCNLNPTI